MRVDEALERITEDLSGEPVSLKVCFAIVRSIAAHDANQFKRISFGMVSRLANKSDAAATMSAIAYLCGDRLPLFLPKYSFIDDDHDELIDDEVMRSLLQGEPYHDDHGDVFENPMEHVFAHFELSALAKNMANSGTK